MNKRYLLRGGHIGFWVGLIVAVTMITGPLIPRFFYKLDIAFLVTKNTENIGFISLLLSYIVYGITFSFLYDKIKN